MKILCLYNNDCALELFDWMDRQGDGIILWKDRLDCEWCRKQNFDLTVSYTYRYILSAEMIHALNDNVVNIHNSLLPWNRGADPNIWSIVDKTPRGVTLHYVDDQLDKGSVIAQEIVDDGDNETLSSSYSNLDKAAKSLFKKAFRYYDFWPSLKKQCMGTGSYHSLKDGIKIKRMIDSYDISIVQFRRQIWQEQLVSSGYRE